MGYQASICSIRLQQIFLYTWFKVEGQVVERWDWPTSSFPTGRGIEPAVLDVTVILTLQLPMEGETSTPGNALRVGEERKMAAHAEACRTVGVLFVPLVVESLGRWSDEAIHTIASIGSLEVQRLGIPRSESI